MSSAWFIDQCKDFIIQSLIQERLVLNFDYFVSIDYKTVIVYRIGADLSLQIMVFFMNLYFFSKIN